MDEKFVEKTDFTLVHVESSPEADFTLVQVASPGEEAVPANHSDKSFPIEYTLDPVNSQLQPIESIGPNFEILSILGEGATGIVYRARHLLLDKIVAIKVLKEEFSGQSKVFRRFQQEAKTTSNLSHENIAMVHDFGLTESGHPFIVMDYIEGLTLAGLIDERINMPEEEAIGIFKQICKALIHAHEHNVIHRDLKPSNIILPKTKSDGWLVKVVDFGIAKVIVEEENSSSPKLTKTGEIFGTPLYMSPEQCQGMQVDHRSDIYSLGCLMYESLMGAPPFTGASTFATLMAQVSQAPTPFQDLKKDSHISDALERVVFHALEKDPDDRYQSVKDLLKDLDNVNQSGATVSASKLYSAPRRTKKKNLLFFCLLSITGLSTLAALLAVAPEIAGYTPLFSGLITKDHSPWAEELKLARTSTSIDNIIAENHYDKAIAIAEKNHATPEQIADLKNELACLLYGIDPSSHKAYELFAYVAKHEPQDNLRHANTFEYLARLENYEASKIDRAVETAKSNKEDAATVNKLTAEAKKLTELAREQAKEAVALKAKILGTRHHTYVENALRSEGQVMFCQGLYPEAEAAFSEALAIARKLNLDGGVTEALRLRDLARCYAQEGKLDQAKTYYRQSIQKYVELFGSEHRSVLSMTKEYQNFLKGQLWSGKRW